MSLESDDSPEVSEHQFSVQRDLLTERLIADCSCGWQAHGSFDAAEVAGREWDIHVKKHTNGCPGHIWESVVVGLFRRRTERCSYCGVIDREPGQ